MEHLEGPQRPVDPGSAVEITVADFAPPRSLLTRAKIAHEYAVQLRTTEELVERADLMTETYSFMLDVLLMSADELQEIRFEFGRFNDVREMLMWRIEGIDFRSRYMLKDLAGNKVLELVVEVNPRGTTTYKAVDTLASLGLILK